MRGTFWIDKGSPREALCTKRREQLAENGAECGGHRAGGLLHFRGTTGTAGKCHERNSV